MSRKERREAAARRRREVLAQVAQVAADVVEDGGSARDGILAADKWLQEQVRENPQEAALYRAVAREYSNELKAAYEAKEKADEFADLGQAGEGQDDRGAQRHFRG
jgi:hypothetical protein